MTDNVPFRVVTKKAAAFANNSMLYEFKKKPQTFDETKQNLEWRIGTDEMIAVELENSHKMIGNVYMCKRDFEALEMGYMQNVPPAIRVHGNCLNL